MDPNRHQLDSIRRRLWEGAIHIIQRVQCTVGVRVTVQALHRQFPSLLHRWSRHSTLPSLPGLAGWVLGVPCRFSVLPVLCQHRRSSLLSSPSGARVARVCGWYATVWTQEIPMRALDLAPVHAVPDPTQPWPSFRLPPSGRPLGPQKKPCPIQGGPPGPQLKWNWNYS